MIERKDIIADLHIHTIGSQHGFSTLKECVDLAISENLKYIAITDHYYADGTELFRRNEISRFKHIESCANCRNKAVYVIGGAEFNISQKIEYWNKLQTLKWKMIGIHGCFLDRENTSLDKLLLYYEKASEKFDAFSHIERDLDKIEHKAHGTEIDGPIMKYLEQIVILAKKKNVILELNEASLNNKKNGNNERALFWLKCAKSNGNLISLGTDAHYCDEIGLFDKSIALLNYVDFPKDRIINYDNEYLKRRFVCLE